MDNGRHAGGKQKVGSRNVITEGKQEEVWIMDCAQEGKVDNGKHSGGNVDIRKCGGGNVDNGERGGGIVDNRKCASGNVDY